MNLFENLQMLKENQNNIEKFINTPIEELVDGKLITAVFDEYSNDYKQLPKGMDATSPEYDEVKGIFYNKYYDVAKKCKEIDKSTKFNPSGYGRFDYFILKARDKCRKIDYSFPYGWKQFGKVYEDLQTSESQEIKYVLTSRHMFSKDFSQRTSFIDNIYNSLEEAETACREFQRDLASHMRAGVEEVNSDLVATGPYWELFRGQFEKKV